MNQHALAEKLAPIVHEDDDYLFINKPAGLVAGPGRRGKIASVLNLLALRADAATLLPLYEVNRWQSGVLGFAKHEGAQHHLLTGLETGSAKPVFVAVVLGKFKTQAQTVEAALQQVGKDRFVVDRKPAGPPLPTTRVEPMERGETRALVRIRPNALNHHQVRAHLAALHLRVVGDDLYRAQPARAQVGPVLLHLAELRFHHPGLRRAVSIRAAFPETFKTALDTPGRTGLDGAVAAALQAALTGRLPFLLDDDTNAFRVLHGRPDGVSGLVAELFDQTLILQAHQGKVDTRRVPLEEVARWYRRRLGVQSVYLKPHVKDRSASGPVPDVLRDPGPLVGKPAPEQVRVCEHGLTFLIKPYDGYAVGLFLDQRDNRRRVREAAAGRRVLNLFAYTCGFSVAAADGGAATTVSVDISRKALAWGKENFEANGFSLDGHWFINDDALNYFKRARRQKRTFDLIILDPPSFARGKKPRRVFHIEKDLPDLVRGAAGILQPGGLLLVCTNHRGATRQGLVETITEAAAPRKVSIMCTPGLPADFPGDPAYAKSVMARIS